MYKVSRPYILLSATYRLLCCKANVHQSHSQNDLRGVARGDGRGTSHLCDGSAHSSGCVVNGSNAMAAF